MNRLHFPSGRLKHAAIIGAALALLAAALVVNRQQQCQASASEWPADCPARVAGSAEHLAQLRDELAGNPGNARAYARLGSLEQGEARVAALRAASALWPGEPNVLRARAALALEQGRLSEAAGDLVRLAELYHHLTQEPAQVLAQLMAAGQAELLLPHVAPGSQWLAPVLSTMHQMKLPLAAGGPVIARASALGALPQQRMGELTRHLKEAGSWVDAYGLWIARHQGRVPLLYNGGFEQPIEADGFDWELSEGPPGRGGVQIERRQTRPRGMVLELRFTGRRLHAVPLRQLLYLGPGRYRVSGQYRVENLRSEAGLVWVVRCIGAPSSPEAGRSPVLSASEEGWSVFEFEVAIPRDCGPVASLQLETQAAYEAAAGLRGKIHFDNFALVGSGAP